MTTVEITNVVASVVSIILGLVALGLSVVFYLQARQTEAAVSIALTRIQTQTDMLQKLTGRWMDRLTKFVTTPRPVDEAIVGIVSSLQDIPTNIVAQLRTPAPSDTALVLRSEVLAGYIAAYYYAAVANVAGQGYLPPLEDLQQDDFRARLVDQSYSDVAQLQVLIAGFEPELLQASSVYHLYDEASASWRPLVKGATMVYQARTTEP